uniref:Uncharacterized protein n=1 Tax=Rhizophora mucronata TaxID=61149 RepID=A0A2P2J1N4_RHIMU
MFVFYLGLGQSQGIRKPQLKAIEKKPLKEMKNAIFFTLQYYL